MRNLGSFTSTPGGLPRRSHVSHDEDGYDPDIGRFISEDPLWGKILDPQSLNRFAYGRNNPFRFIDPTGMFNIDEEVKEGNFGLEGPGFEGGSWTDDFGLDTSSNGDSLFGENEGPISSGNQVSPYGALNPGLKDFTVDIGTLYRVEMSGVGGGFGGYFEGGVFTFYDDLAKKGHSFYYVAFGGGYVRGVSGQPEVGIAIGSSNPDHWTGSGHALNFEVISLGLYGAGGQISWSGDNIMYTTGPHLGTPGGSGVYTSTYTWYNGEVPYK